MSNPVFPTLVRGEDSKNYSVEFENVAVSAATDGGYVVTRAKHTRRPRRTFTGGFTDIGMTDKTTLENFWNTVKGGSVIFDWLDPVTKTVIAVRFADKDPMQFKYTGMGGNHRWDVTYKIIEA